MLMRAAAVAAVVLAWSPAFAEDALKVSVAGRGAFESQVSEVGEQQSLFKKHGLALEVLYSRGSRETLAAVTTGAADIGTSVGTLGALGAFGKGAPIRLIGGSMIGVSEFWYVPINSPIKSLKQAAGKNVAHSATGSASNLMVLALQELHGIKVRPVATGNPAATFAQVASGQVDVGYSVPPFAVAELEQGKIRIIARGNDIPALAKQTVRFIVANADALEGARTRSAAICRATATRWNGCSRPTRRRSRPIPHGPACRRAWRAGRATILCDGRTCCPTSYPGSTPSWPTR